MDERNKQIYGKSGIITLGIVYVIILIYALWKYISTADITNITSSEVFFIVFIPISFLYFAREDESLMLPKDAINQKELPKDSSPKSQKIRKKNYFLESLLSSIVFTIMSILDSMFISGEWDYNNFFSQMNQQANIIISLIINFFIMLFVFYIATYFIGEVGIKKYRTKMEDFNN